MLTKRIIPCLDIADGRVVKGINFKKLRDAGDPVEIAKAYDEAGADELIFLDITASSHKHKTVFELAREVAMQVFIPFCIGGGIGSVDDIREALLAGADKVSFNSSAIKNPKLIDEGAKRFGSQCMVLSLDAKRHDNSYHVYTHGGRVDTGIDAIKWAKEACERGVGEILLNSMDGDGTKKGYDLELIEKVTASVNVPIIASGGAGALEDFKKGLDAGADAVLAASLFHYNEMSIGQVKEYLIKEGFPIRKTT